VDDHDLVISDLQATAPCDQTSADGPAALAALEGTHRVDITDRDRLVLTRGDDRIELEADPEPPTAGS
jgi:hypothetical protein